MIPFLDLNRIHEPLVEEFVLSLRGILERSTFHHGAELTTFERNFAQWVGTTYCVGLASGLDAEIIGLRAMGLKPGEQVIVPALTFIATVAAVNFAGGQPILVDVDSNGLIDLEQVEEELKKGARFIVPVHLFGQMIDMNSLNALVKSYGTRVLEDSCQAHGAFSDPWRSGTLGEASAFSFYPGKNLGALGDGGALCTNDPKIDQIARALREHGQTKKYFHEYEGYTSRLDTLQAAFLSKKLPFLTQWNQQRIEAAQYYSARLKGTRGIRLQSNDSFQGGHVYHLYVLLVNERAKLVEEFEKRQIGFGFHYPIPIHQLNCYQTRNWGARQYPRAEEFSQKGISLPLFPGITRVEQDQVLEAIFSACG